MGGRYIDDADWPSFRALLRAWDTGELLRRDQPMERSSVQQQQSCLVVLLEDLNSGGFARAERLRRENRYEVMDIMVVGGIPGTAPVDPEAPPDEETPPPSFTLQLPASDDEEEGDTQFLPEVPVTATAEEVYQLYAGSDSPIKDYLVAVGLGRSSDDGNPMMRWRLVLEPLDGRVRPLLEVGPHTLGDAADILVQHVPYVGTGSDVTVFSVIPTGDPTPIRAGSQCGCRFFPGTGWGVTEAEPRKFEPIIGDEYPYYG